MGVNGSVCSPKTSDQCRHPKPLTKRPTQSHFNGFSLNITDTNTEDSPRHLLPVATVTLRSKHERQQGTAGRDGDKGETSRTEVGKQREGETKVILLLARRRHCCAAPSAHQLPDSVSAV